MVEPDSFNNHSGKYSDLCACRQEEKNGKTETLCEDTGAEAVASAWKGASCTWKRELKFEAPIIDCTDNDGSLPTKNFVRFKATSRIEKGSYWVEFGGVTNPLSFQPT